MSVKFSDLDIEDQKYIEPHLRDFYDKVTFDTRTRWVMDFSQNDYSGYSSFDTRNYMDEDQFEAIKLDLFLNGLNLYEVTEFGNIHNKQYDKDILNLLAYPRSIFSELSHPGLVMKPLKSIRDELHFDGSVVLVATHDTASAVEGIDICLNNIYLSSGTWSLLGVKIDTPILSEHSRKMNYSHEGGRGYYRYQKNIMGLWIIEELMREMKIDTYEEIVNMAKSAHNVFYFNANDEKLFAPESMLNCVKYLIFEKYHVNIVDSSDLINSVYHSLAQSYKIAIDEIEKLTNTKYNDFYIFGGGTKNNFLNELIKKYTEKNVKILSTEATAIGNIKIQKEVMKYV